MFTTKRYLTVAITLLGLQFTNPVFAEIFKCKTENGQTIYSSKKCADTAEIFTPKKQSHSQSLNLSEETEAKPSVDIYITSWCPYCKKAMAYLRSENIAFNTFDIEKNPQAKTKKQELAPGYTGVPLTVINGKILKGFSEDRFKQALAL